MYRPIRHSIAFCQIRGLHAACGLYVVPRRQTIMMKANKREMAMFDSKDKRGSCMLISVHTNTV